MSSGSGRSNDDTNDVEGKPKSDLASVSEAADASMSDQNASFLSRVRGGVPDVYVDPDADPGDTIHRSNTTTHERKPTVVDIFAQPFQDAVHRNQNSGDGLQQGSGLQQNENQSGNGIGIGKPKKNHGRNVSWGVVPNEGEIHFSYPEDDDVLPSGNHGIPSAAPQQRQQSGGSNKEKIDLYDVINHQPVEPETETKLLHTLQKDTTSDQRSTSSQRSVSQRSVLPNVPDEAMKRGFSFRQKPHYRVPRHGHTRQQLHKRTLTLEEKLVGLADALDALHNLPESMERDTASQPPDRFSLASNSTAGLHAKGSYHASAAAEPKPTILTESEKLQQNATMLLGKRMSVADADENAKDGQKIDETTATSAPLISDALPAVIAYTNSEFNKHLQESFSGGASPNNSTRDEESGNDEGKNQAKNDGEGAETMSAAQPGSVSNIDEDDEKNFDDGTGTPDNANSETKSSERRRGRKQNALLKEFDSFIGQSSTSIRTYIKMAGQYIFLPSLGLAAILFYFADNPPTGVWDDDDVDEGIPRVNATLPTPIVNNSKVDEAPQATASASWWLLFFGVRQLLTFSLSKLLEMFVIDYLSIRSHFSVRNFGPWVTLFVMQSRGWPFCIFCWAALDLVLLAGSHPFFSHWLYWQDYVGLFNESNPGGNVVDSDANHRILAIAVSVGAVVAVKRFWMGIYLGRQTYAQFADRLASLMKKILIISEVSHLGRTIQRQVEVFGIVNFKCGGLAEGKLADLLDNTVTDGEGDDNKTHRSTMGDDPKYVVDPTDRDPLTRKLSNSQRTRIAQILGAWEEPIATPQSVSDASVVSILQFRRALSTLRTRYPFSSAFGLADSRENCIETAQEVYKELLMRTPDAEVLNFDTLALLAVEEDGNIDQQKLEDMVRLFRPDRDGTITMIDFVKSIDRVYRNLRLFNASIINSSKIDNAFESIINIAFYTIVATIILSQLGFDPLALFLSVSGVVLAFAFMIGSASSKYFEGLLFILVRRPYSIGDCIHISDVNSETSAWGSGWWTVEDINLFTTKVNFLFTGERATLNNGSLANSRIINSSRSANAEMYFTLKFAIDVPYGKIKIIEQAAIEFVHRRPREWLAWGLFRAMQVHADRGYVEYVLGATHRETWSHWATVQYSKAQLAMFCVEVSKALGILYHTPIQPIYLHGASGQFESLPFSQQTIPLATSQVNETYEDLAAQYATQVSALQEKFAPSN